MVFAAPQSLVREYNGGVGSISYAGGQADIVLDESPRPGGIPPGGGRTDMTSAPTLSSQDRTTRFTVTDDVHQPLRLRLKPKAPTTGRVDGGWWPRSRNLAAELPRLLSVLSVRLGPIERVSYHLGDWDPTVRKISIGDRVVRLAGYRSQHADTVDVLAARQRVTLLVVSPEATTQAAHAALMAAGHRGNTEDVETLLKSGLVTALPLDEAGGEADAAGQRWELDGGQMYELAGVDAP
jgi:hypothetical protein